MQYLVHHMLRDSAWRDAHREAIVGSGQRIDYATMAERVAALSGGLQALGVRRGDRVAVFLGPTASLPLAIFAASQAAGVFVPVHHGLFPDQVAHILRDSGAKTLITDAGRWEGLADSLATLPDLAFAVLDGPPEAASPLPTYDLQTLLEHPPSTTGETCTEKDLAAILYTSGSTGLPKGVMLSHANILAGTEIVATYLSITHADHLLAALPFSFDAGLNQLMTAVLKGAATIMVGFRFGSDIVRAVVDERITALAGVPSLWSLLAQPSSGLGKQPVDHLRYITNTGGAMPRTVLARLRELLPHTDVYLMYGLTEAFRSTYLPPDELDRRPDSIGKAIPNTEILVIDDHGRRCGPGDIGELVHDGPTVSLGYWGNPELTDRVLRPHPYSPPGRGEGDRVCYSGDLVTMDGDGFLYFVGRRDNQIKSSGFRISPTEVEEIICRIAPIRQAAVVGVPDPVLGQHLVAFAIPDEDAGSLEAAEILVRCAGAMPPGSQRQPVSRRFDYTNVSIALAWRLRVLDPKP